MFAWVRRHVRLGSAPRSLGFGATSAWGLRRPGFWIEGTMPTVNAIRAVLDGDSARAQSVSGESATRRLLTFPRFDLWECAPRANEGSGEASAKRFAPTRGARLARRD